MSYNSNLIFNKKLLEQLETLQNKAKLSKDTVDKFRAKSYKDAIDKIKVLPFDITEESQIPLTKTSKIYAKVKQFIENGTIEGVDELSASQNVYRELIKVAEIGPSKAKDLIENHGIKSLEDLGKNLDLLNEKQKIGYKYWKTDCLRIPREEILAHREIYLDIARNIPNFDFEITGSFRRGSKDSGDIDILITSKNNDTKVFKIFVNSLIQRKYLIDNLAYGNKKYMGYGCLNNGIPRRIDIIYCSPSEYPMTLLYFTGCGSINVKMREYCIKLGYKLNEKGLFHSDTNLPVDYTFRSEQDIFDFLKLPYVEPQNRTETYEFN